MLMCKTMFTLYLKASSLPAAVCQETALHLRGNQRTYYVGVCVRVCLCESRKTMAAFLLQDI